MKTLCWFILVFAIISNNSSGQVSVNADNSTPDPSAGLDVKFSNKGVLIPRLTRIQRNSIPSPADGLMVYCTNCGAGGALSIFTNGEWLTFAPCNTIAPSQGIPQMAPGKITWNWMAVSGAIGYKWNTVADYETAIDMGNALTRTETGTVCDSTYSRFVWTYSICGESAMTTLTATVPAIPPVAPADSIHTATQATITWRWHVVPGALGYKWNTTNNYVTAIDLGTTTMMTETMAPAAPFISVTYGHTMVADNQWWTR